MVCKCTNSGLSSAAGGAIGPGRPAPSLGQPGKGMLSAVTPDCSDSAFTATSQRRILPLPLAASARVSLVSVTTTVSLPGRCATLLADAVPWQLLSPLVDAFMILSPASRLRQHCDLRWHRRPQLKRARQRTASSPFASAFPRSLNWL
jgi:hypothetical protein